jgi:3',5'-nucleoside bisphosphate phosphatase
VPGIDLHCHTTASDGLCSPSELVAAAAARELDVIAVTDHDTIEGVKEAMEAGAASSVRVVAGIELSTRMLDRGAHILGYFLETSHGGLLDALARMRRDRDERGRRMVERLQALGYELTFDDVLEQAGGGVVARPHIARALVSRGYVPTVRDAFTAELIADGGRAYVGRPEITPVEAVELIRSAGGAAVIAHPSVAHHAGDTDPVPERLVEELRSSGLAGLEVDHPDQAPLIRDRLQELAARLDLVPTGGSDYHGEKGRRIGICTTTPESFEVLEARAGG